MDYKEYFKIKELFKGMKKVITLNTETRELFKDTTLQYMIDTLIENPRLLIIGYVVFALVSIQVKIQ
ncbi:MAG: hypothetical protein WDA24_11375 [Tissierellales bacterium]